MNKGDSTDFFPEFIKFSIENKSIPLKNEQKFL